jgi:hypothetical protein
MLVPFRTLSIFYLFPSDTFTSPQLLSFLIIYTSNISPPTHHTRNRGNACGGTWCSP